MSPKPWARFTVAALACVALLLGSSRTAGVEERSYDFSTVRELLDQNLGAFGGKLVMLVGRDGERLFSYQHGGLTSESALAIGSAGGWLATAVACRLAEEGRFGLDDPVGVHLPELKRPGKGDVTIRQALSMSSGLATEEGFDARPARTLEDSVALIASRAPADFPFGQGIAADDASLQVVGLIAQRATGAGWRELARTRLFEPCGMSSTGYGEDAAGLSVASGIRTTPSDVMRFLRMLTNRGTCQGAQVLSADSVREMLASQTAGLRILRSPFPSSSSWFPNGDFEIHTALGSWIFAEDPKTGEVAELAALSRGGVLAWIDLERNLYGAVFTDVEAAGGPAVETELHAIQLVRNAVDDAEQRAVNLGVYFDPEFLSEQDLMTFQDGGRGAIWLTYLDPRTGFFARSSHGRDVLLSPDAAPLIETNNGPEFGVDARGWGVYYTRALDGVYRAWRTSYDGSSTTSTVLTGPDVHRVNVFPTRNPELPRCLLIYIKGTAEGGTIAWASEAEPEDEHDIAYHRRGLTVVQWIPGSEDVIAAKVPEGEKNHRLAIIDAHTAELDYITDGSTDLNEPAPFLAPEYGGELLIAAVENGAQVVVLRDTGGRYWEVVSRLPVPAESAYTEIESPEAFTFRGRSYLSLQIETPAGRYVKPGEVWVFGIDDEPGRRVAIRCDDGSPDPIIRTDPEFYVGADDAFIYYNVVTRGRDRNLVWETWRCRVGLGTHPLAGAAPGE